MSKIFYDHLIILEEVDYIIRGVVETSEEKEELWRLVDETINYRVLVCILDRLPQKHHKEFLEKFHSAPHDESHIIYINEKIGGGIEKIIQEEIKIFSGEILKEFNKGKNSV